MQIANKHSYGGSMRYFYKKNEKHVLTVKIFSREFYIRFYEKVELKFRKEQFMIFGVMVLCVIGIQSKFGGMILDLVEQKVQ